MTLTILADDLTGACDTASLFAGKGPVTVDIWPVVTDTGAVRAIDTETRATAAATARDRVVRAAFAAPARRYFKKIDSTLRGHIGPEVEALMQATRAPHALVTPAFPAQRRVVVDRVLTIDGRPVADTPIACDPRFPATRASGRRSSSVTDLLRPQLDRPLAWVPLAQVRAGTLELAARLRRLAGTVVVADAETDADLEALVDATLELDPPPLLVGSAGLGRALAARLGVLVEHVSVPVDCRWLCVIGSLHPASRGQADAARKAGLAVLATPDERHREPALAATRLAAEVARLLATDAFDLIAVTGGETALAVCRALDVHRVEVLGPPMPGLALGRLGGKRDRWIITKAGGFGAPDVFVSLAMRTTA